MTGTVHGSSGGWDAHRRALSDTVPDRIIQARRFKRIFGRRLDLRDPRTFNEKLHWLMLRTIAPRS